MPFEAWTSTGLDWTTIMMLLSWIAFLFCLPVAAKSLWLKRRGTAPVFSAVLSLALMAAFVVAVGFTAYLVWALSRMPY